MVQNNPFIPVQLVHLPNPNLLIFFIVCLMKAIHEPVSTLNRSHHKPSINQKVVKASDIKLNDVLINGVKLRCFHAIKNNRICLIKKHPFSVHHQEFEQHQEREELEENTLFKNKAIKRRLKSLESDFSSTIAPQYEAIAPKKLSTRLKEVSKVPILMLPSSSRENKYSGSNYQHLSFKFIDINNQYYSQLKKELLMYTTNNRFNSSTMKSRMKYGKYIGLQTKRQQKVTSHRESNLIKQQSDRHEYFLASNRYQHQLQNRQRFYTSFDEKEQNEQKHHNTLNDQRQSLSLEGSNNRLKICYSTKNDFKRWKDLTNKQNRTFQATRSRNSDTNPEEKLISTMALE